MNLNTLRHDQRYTFLKNIGLCLNDIVFFNKDMSARQYFKVKNKPYLIMDVPPPDSIKSYVNVACILRKHGIRAPQIYQTDEKLGFALIEDFGNSTYANLIKNNKTDTKKLYGLAIDVIQHLNTKIQQKPHTIEYYSIEKLLNESKLFIQWYWPYFFHKKANQKIEKEFLNILAKYYKNLPQTPQSLVLRDYHLDNLMYVEGEGIQKCGVLDFQDAQWGSLLYDYISLVEDARYDVHMDIVDYCWKKLTKDLNIHNRKLYEHTSRVLGLGRHLKILGVFARYAILYHNESKLIHISRIWRHIWETCSFHEFSELKKWLQNYF